MHVFFGMFNFLLCLAAIFGNFKMVSFFEYKLFLRAVLDRTTAMCFRNIFRIFFEFLIFDQKEPFCKGYSPSLLAIFGNFQNDLIFRIFAVFSGPILHRTTPMCHIETFLACCFCIFNF